MSAALRHFTLDTATSWSGRAKGQLSKSNTGRLHSVIANAGQQPDIQTVQLSQRVSVTKRDLLKATASTVLALYSGFSLPASAEETSSSGTQVYFDVKVEGKPIGRIAIELFTQDCPVGTERFKDLVLDQQGVGYRLSKFNGIFPTYIRNEGVKSLSYSATEDSPIAGGDSTEQLEVELEAQKRSHDQAGLVSIIVTEANERPVKEKLVAYGGKLVTIKQVIGEAPNGTSFVITRGADPSLDGTNLIVGRVVSGMDVVESIGALPFSRPREEYYDKPFFTVAKAIGDRRADTAEKGFNRPLKRVVISGGGVA